LVTTSIINKLRSLIFSIHSFPLRGSPLFFYSSPVDVEHLPERGCTEAGKWGKWAPGLNFSPTWFLDASCVPSCGIVFVSFSLLFALRFLCTYSFLFSSRAWQWTVLHCEWPVMAALSCHRSTLTYQFVYYRIYSLITLLLTLGNPPHIRRDGALHRAGTIMLCSSPPFISPPHYLSYPPTGLPFLPTQLHPPYAYPSLPCP
jgi:hypothetical protein